MTEPQIGLLADALKDEMAKPYPGVVTGTVIDVADPLFMGRVRVRVPSIDSLDLLPWARVAVPMAGFTPSLPHGTYFIPQPGTEVLVVFENGDLDSPYVIGCLWNGSAPPPLPNPLLQIRAIRTPAGSQIVFNELPQPTITIQAGPTPPAPIPTPPTPTTPPPTIMVSSTGVTIMSPTAITLFSGASSIMIGPGGIMLTVGPNGISISPQGIVIQGKPTVQINPAG